jgi:glycosyltransferase involved in cell wall biosynthesis
MPKVSVVIPAYNRADLLPRSMGSVLNQTFHDIELMVVDDGSTDNTKKLVEEWAARDPRVKYVWEKNSGYAATPRNVGIGLAKGEYVALLDSDDEWLPTKIEKQLALFENSSRNLGFVGCGINIIDDSTGNTLRVHKMEDYLKGDPVEALLQYNFILTGSAVMVKRKVFDRVGNFNKEMRFADDLDMWLRVLDFYEFDFVAEPLIKYYIHPENSRSQLNIDGDIVELEHVFLKHREKYLSYPSIYHTALRRLGSKYCAMGKSRKGRGYYLESLKSKPLALKMWFLYVSSFVFGRRTYSMVYNMKKKSFS